MHDTVEADIAAIARIGAVPLILKTIRQLTGLRFTLVSRVLSDRWVACAVHDELELGLAVGGELDVATTFCSKVRETHAPVVIEHASVDPVYCSHPSPKMYGFESYIAVPLFRKDGEYFGTVCGFDPEPHLVRNEKTIATMKLFSNLITLQLDAEDRHREEIAAERADAGFREQFIAVLGHDVRNPLSSIVMGTALLLGTTTEPAARRTLERIRTSTRRINGLVENLLDLARGRLGGGIVIEVSTVGDIAARVRHVVAEIQASHPDRTMSVTVSHSAPVHCDGERLEQLASNLLANAIEHGRPSTPIHVTIGGDSDTFELRVANEGETIPEVERARLFHPYFRGGQTKKTAGLGLGLYIASEIARAHGGHMVVTSVERLTTFAFTMPRRAQPSLVPSATDSART